MQIYILFAWEKLPLNKILLKSKMFEGILGSWKRAFKNMGKKTGT